jgi:CheY-like chemotaxis protein
LSQRVEITTFSTAKAAIEYIESQDLTNREADTVLLTDLHMPELDGFALLDRLESTPKALKDRLHVFVVSGEACPEEVRRLFSYSYVIGFLEKPLSDIKIDQVIECVQYLL